jgi:capsular polysaccharide biosynthesis protein
VNQGGSVSNDVLLGLQRISATYAKMIDSYAIAVDAVDRARAGRTAEALQGQLTATPETGTQLLKVSVTDTQPQAAQVLANAVVDTFVEKISTFEPGQAGQEGQPPALPAYVFERARLPVAPAPTDLVRNLILNGLFGLVIAVGLAFLLDYLDVTIKTPAEAERRLELPVLGAIPLEPHPELYRGPRTIRAA